MISNYQVEKHYHCRTISILRSCYKEFWIEESHRALIVNRPPFIAVSNGSKEKLRKLRAADAAQSVSYIRGRTLDLAKVGQELPAFYMFLLYPLP